MGQFQGTAKPLDDIDIPRMGWRIGVGEDEVHAFMEVESASSGFDSQGRPKMLFEPHVFYRQLSGKPRREAIRRGLAYRSWGEEPYPSDSYPRLQEAMEIDQSAALKSASWGLGQILGTNHSMVGYDTIEEMVDSFMEDEENHLEAIINFIIAAGIDDDLRAHRWETVARVYNGPGYARHGYHTRLASAYAKWAQIPDTPWEPDDDTPPPSSYPTIRRGSNGFMARHLQERLDELGYRVGDIDGRFGRETRAAVLAFQADNGLDTDGVMGPVSWEALETIARPRQVSEERRNATTQDLRDRGSRTVRDGDAAQTGGAILTGTGGLAAVSEALGDAEEASGALSGVLTALEPIISFASDNWWILLGGAGLAVFLVGNHVKQARLDDHRSGKNMGR